MSEKRPESETGQPDRKGLSELVSGLERASGALALGFLICYILGFLVVNAYLFGFGFYEYGIFKPRYVAAGLLLLVYTAVPAFPAFFVVSRYLSQHPEMRPALPTGNEWADGWRSAIRQGWLLRATIKVLKRLAPRFIFAWLLALLTTQLFHFIVWSFGYPPAGTMFVTNWVNVYRPIIWATLVALLGLEFASLTRATGALKVWSLATVVVLFILPMSVAYGRVIYPLISPSLGGGRASSVILITDEAHRSVLARLVPLWPDASGQPSPPTSAPVLLLDATDDSYLLLAPSESNPELRGVEVRKEWIKGIVQVKALNAKPSPEGP